MSQCFQKFSVTFKQIVTTDESKLNTHTHAILKYRKHGYSGLNTQILLFPFLKQKFGVGKSRAQKALNNAISHHTLFYPHILLFMEYLFPHAHDLIFLRWLPCIHIHDVKMVEGMRESKLCLISFSIFYKENETFPEASHSCFPILSPQQEPCHTSLPYMECAQREGDCKKSLELIMSAIF